MNFKNYVIPLIWRSFSNLLTMPLAAPQPIACDEIGCLIFLSGDALALHEPLALLLIDDNREKLLNRRPLPGNESLLNTPSTALNRTSASNLLGRPKNPFTANWGSTTPPNSGRQTNPSTEPLARQLNRPLSQVWQMSSNFHCRIPGKRNHCSLGVLKKGSNEQAEKRQETT